MHIPVLVIGSMPVERLAQYQRNLSIPCRKRCWTDEKTQSECSECNGCGELPNPQWEINGTPEPAETRFGQYFGSAARVEDLATMNVKKLFPRLAALVDFRGFVPRERDIGSRMEFHVSFQEALRVNHPYSPVSVWDCHTHKSTYTDWKDQTSVPM